MTGACTGRTLRQISDQTTEDRLTPYVLLKETYETARLQVLRVGTAVDRVLASLLEL